MKTLMRRSLSTTLLVSAFGSVLWSPSSMACDGEPYIGSICVMAMNGNYSFANGQYMPAAGQQLSITQYTALYAVLGTSFGGNNTSNFNLPDLRGKVIVGYDERVPAQRVGTTGGATSVSLTIAQLPPHQFMIALPVSLTGLVATTALTGLSGTANLSNITLSGPASGLVIKASSQSGLGTPNGNFIGKGNGAQGNNYSASAPDVTLNNGSIAGNLSLTVNSGTTVPVAVSGTATTTVSGNGSVSGATNILGSAAGIPTMPPYLVMPYFIAVNGLYPSRD